MKTKRNKFVVTPIHLPQDAKPKQKRKVRKNLVFSFFLFIYCFWESLANGICKKRKRNPKIKKIIFS